MAHTAVETSKIYKSPAPFSPATVTAETTWIHISGQVGQNSDGVNVGIGDIEAQTTQALENMKALVEAAGGKMSDVAKVVIYLLDRSSLAKVMEVRRRYFSEPYPAATAVIVSGLAHPDWLVEIEGLACIA